MNSAAPKLSIIVASIDSPAQLHRFTGALDRQPRIEECEVIVMDSGAGHRQPLPRLWGDGIARARGEWIAIMETTCPPAPGWLAAALEAMNDCQEIFGGAVELAKGKSLVDWSAYFCEYGQFMRPLSQTEVRELPGNNICFRRDLLARAPQFTRDGFWKTYWCRELMKQGVRLARVPAMAVEFDKSYRLMPFLIRRFHHGRCFAGMRLEPARFSARVMFAGGTMLLPLLSLWRITRSVLAKRRNLFRFAASLPVTLFAVATWSLGEFCGYTLGPGSSCGRIY